MFDVEVCEARQVVLFRFGTSFVTADLVALDRLATAASGAGPFDCIFDLARVETFDLKPEFVAERGEIPQAFKDRQRFYVVTHDDLKLLVRLYATYQENKGWRPPEIVATLDEALVWLGVDRTAFRPVAIEAIYEPQASRQPRLLRHC
jgi:hypothetical protein